MISCARSTSATDPGDLNSRTPRFGVRGAHLERARREQAAFDLADLQFRDQNSSEKRI